MNIFELIAIGIICLTVLAVCLIATKHPLTIKHTYIYTPVEQTTQPVEHKQDTKSTEPEKTNADIEKEINKQNKLMTASMDAIIASVNNLMGVEVAEEEDANGSK